MSWSVCRLRIYRDTNTVKTVEAHIQIKAKRRFCIIRPVSVILLCVTAQVCRLYHTFSATVFLLLFQTIKNCSPTLEESDESYCTSGWSNLNEQIVGALVANCAKPLPRHSPPLSAMLSAGPAMRVTTLHASHASYFFYFSLESKHEVFCYGPSALYKRFFLLIYVSYFLV